MGITSRIYNICQYENNPDTGEDLHFGEDNIKAGVAHKTIKKWAYILHDKDTYTADDERNNPAHKCGTLKPRHWHCVISMDRAMDVDVVAKWFGIEPQYVEKPKGMDRRAFMDCVEYLTHSSDKQQTLGKYLYPDESVVAAFDWRKELDERMECRAKYGRDSLSDKERMRMDVLEGRKTLAQCKAADPVLYADDIMRLRVLRNEYLSTIPLPPVRLNYYIEGDGGMGKGTLARMLAKSLFPGLPDDECFFSIGSKGASFEKYDGQPVILWHDRRAAALLDELGGRDNAFNVLDAHPDNARQNIKYGSVNLINSVNIIDGVEPYKVFLDGLAGEYTASNGTSYKAEDKTQAYRRFPMIMCLRKTDFDILINKGFAEGTFEFDQYTTYKRIQGNFANIALKLDGAASEKVLAPLVEPAASKHHEFVTAVTESKISDPDKLPDEFKDYGKEIVVPPVTVPAPAPAASVPAAPAPAPAKKEPRHYRMSDIPDDGQWEMNLDEMKAAADAQTDAGGGMDINMFT